MSTSGPGLEHDDGKDLGDDDKSHEEYVSKLVA